MHQTNAKISLIQKIITARLTRTEMLAVTKKAQDILFRRTSPKNNALVKSLKALPFGRAFLFSLGNNEIHKL